MPDSQPKKIVLLGATGSIGRSALDVIQRHPDHYQLLGVAANKQDQALLAQCLAFQPQVAVLQDADAAARLSSAMRQVDCQTEVLCGREALVSLTQMPAADIVIAAITGAAGLESTLSAVRAGKRVLLANKESLVMAGELLMAEVMASGAELLPLDSEHCALMQCLLGAHGTTIDLQQVEKLLLTGSGGPFRGWSFEQLQQATPELACQHPNWQMGKKISVDSATLMNKGLELIEACHLFGVNLERLQVIIHPQSIIHSMVSYTDGTTLAQLSLPDMRTVIAYGLAWPARTLSGVKTLDFSQVQTMTFELPDRARFPCLGLAEQSMGAGGSSNIVLNAANECAVDAFLQRQIRFTEIPKLIESVLEKTNQRAVSRIDDILCIDRDARASAYELLAMMGSG